MGVTRAAVRGNGTPQQRFLAVGQGPELVYLMERLLQLIRVFLFIPLRARCCQHPGTIREERASAANYMRRKFFQSFTLQCLDCLYKLPIVKCQASCRKLRTFPVSSLVQTFHKPCQAPQ
eukprot:753374-Hanusia_phi.AAC.1